MKMTTMKKTGLTLALALAALAVPQSVRAADWDMTVSEGSDNNPATTWRYKVDNSDPGDGGSCAANNYGWQSGGYLDVFSLGEPFSGSATRSRWVTTCKSGNYLTYELIISMNNCGFWICDYYFTARTTRAHNVTHTEKIVGSLTTKQLDAVVNP